MWLAGTADNSCYSLLGTAPCHTGHFNFLPYSVVYPSIVCELWKLQVKTPRWDQSPTMPDPQRAEFITALFPSDMLVAFDSQNFQLQAWDGKRHSLTRWFPLLSQSLWELPVSRTQYSARVSSARPADTVWELWVSLCPSCAGHTEGVSGFHLSHQSSQ